MTTHDHREEGAYESGDASDSTSDSDGASPDLSPDWTTLPFRPFHITPLHRDDGPTDVSINHDRYFADWTLETLQGPKRRDTDKPGPPS